MTNDMDRLLECAIREKGIIDRMKELDRIADKRKRMWFKAISWCAAACVVLCFGIGLKLNVDARNAGYSLNPADFCRGGSEITALMQEKRIDEAMSLIEENISEVENLLVSPDTEDPDYLLQLKADREELEFLNALCLLRKGRYFKARRVLETISAAGGIYAPQAALLMEKM